MVGVSFILMPKISATPKAFHPCLVNLGTIFPFPVSVSLRNPRNIFHSRISAENNNNGMSQDRKDESKGNDVEDLKDDLRPLFDFKWRDLLDPDPENIFALALTGVLTWASVQVLWQLFFISIAIVIAAIKYSFIAAILLFILITLL